MSVIGKLHEIALYGLVSAVVAVCLGLATPSDLLACATGPSGVAGVFKCYLFWASVAFIPIATVGAFATKYGDGGEGLTFKSDNLLVIAFSHVAEDLIGLVATPFWLLKYIFTHTLDAWKIVDTVLYAAELAFIAAGFLALLG